MLENMEMGLLCSLSCSLSCSQFCYFSFFYSGFALQVSNNNLVRSLYADVEVSESLGRKNLITFKYLKNLNNIISYLKSTNIYFIKCIKPNENKEKNNFNQKKVFPQLFALSIIETLNISFFFQYKYKFDVFLSYFEYLDYSTSKDSNLTDKEKVSTILQNTVDPDLYKVIIKEKIIKGRAYYIYIYIYVYTYMDGCIYNYVICVVSFYRLEKV